jgi:RNA ligase (TIGR02306 family)
MNMSERKLASIQKILALDPIEGADKIEVATILGWKCVVPKGQHRVEELVVFFEIDSLLPRTEWSEFLFKDNREKFRLKTIRLRGQISQGLVLPLNILEKDANIESNYGEIYHEDDDVTTILCIEKYEPYIPAHLSGVIKSSFPSFIPKTDEERIQTCKGFIDMIDGYEVLVTEKLDGSSMTVYLKDGEFGVCSRNLDLKETEDNAFWKTARKLDLENKLKKLQFNCSLQGELVGQGVQSNKYKLNDVNFFIFNVFNIDEFEYLSEDEAMLLVDAMGLLTVPRFDKFVFNKELHSVDNLVELSKGMSFAGDNIIREGIVIRPVNKMRHPKFGRVSFKIINPEFLLKYGE